MTGGGGQVSFKSKAKLKVININVSSGQLAQIALAEFFSKLILIYPDFACEPGPEIGQGCTASYVLTLGLCRFLWQISRVQNPQSSIAR